MKVSEHLHYCRDHDHFSTTSGTPSDLDTNSLLANLADHEISMSIGEVKHGLNSTDTRSVRHCMISYIIVCLLSSLLMFGYKQK